MIKFSKEKVLLLHQLIAEETGGSIGVRDEGLLESALEAAFSTFGGQELYPTKEEKGARIGFNLISNRAFVDGNKRIGMHVMLTFLLVNGIRLNCTNEDVVEAGLGVALVNALIAETLTGEVVFRPLDPPQYVEIGIATPPAESMSPAAKRFLAFVRAHLQG